MSRMCSLVLEEVHRSILSLLRQIASSNTVSSLLDVGCWDGSTTLEYARATGAARVFGIEVFVRLKNVWLPMSEIARVLRVGGNLLFSVPNLARLHNRALLAVGVQPTSIRTFGPPVRSFTLGQTRAFLCEGEVFRVRRVSAAGFYPLPAKWARAFAAAFPGAAHTSILWVQKAEHRSEWPWAAYAQVLQATNWTGATE